MWASTTSTILLSWRSVKWITTAPHLKRSAAGNLGPRYSGGEQRLKVVVKIPRAKVLRRCFPPLRQVTADTRVMKGPAIEKQALHGTTCGIYGRRSRMHRPERALYLPPGGNRSTRWRGEGCGRGGEGAVHARGDYVDGGGGEEYAKTKHRRSLLLMLLPNIWGCGTYTSLWNPVSLRWTMA